MRCHQSMINVCIEASLWLLHTISNKWYVPIIIWLSYMSMIYGAGLILGLRQANERRRYFVTASLIGWAQA